MKIPNLGLSRSLLKFLRTRTCTQNLLKQTWQQQDVRVNQRPLTYCYVGKLHKGCKISKRYYSTSRLFISDSTAGQISQYVDLDLDIDARLSDPKKLKANMEARKIQFSVDELVTNRRRMLDIKEQKERLEMEREENAKQMAVLVREKKGLPEFSALSRPMIERGKEVKEKLKSIMSQWWEVEENVMLTALSLPNNLHPQTPDSSPEVVEEYFAERKMSSDLSHYEIMKKSNLVKFSNVGPRAYYLQEKLALLEQNLIRYFSRRLEVDGFIHWTCPEMFKPVVVEGSGMDFMNRNELFCLQQKSKSDFDSSDSSSSIDSVYFRGVSLASFSAYLTRSFIEESALPMRLFTVGKSYVPCTQNSLPGLYGGVQSTKCCVLGICRSPEESWDMCNNIREKVISLIKPFKVPMRLVVIPASCLHSSEEYRMEVQIWVPSQEQYVMMGSVSMLSDYVSRRLMIRCGENPNHLHKSSPVHMVYGEVMDISRLIYCMVEYNKLEVPQLENT
ncbi:hypothetical protein CHS0354_036035 [Potamilus streckersoni]|uniref:Aminoacyl-transfer RNA synthetases class-II family profile domain-containing protein n=1 Tax=Potamilus streckersoni TaxID=2493646 RepID=A0AAE0TEV8_9BIVA|nr:hypothetical protein CHS0354_036035 [Potamilus streckersoni]